MSAKGILIMFVLVQFRKMGASDEQLIEEKNKLECDEMYFRKWCMNIKSWCPEVPIFILHIESSVEYA